jgi:hypothetical protein
MKFKKLCIALSPSEKCTQSSAATARLHFSLVSRATAIFWKFHQLRNCVFSRLRVLQQFFGNSLAFLWGNLKIGEILCRLRKNAFMGVLPKRPYGFSGKFKSFYLQNFAMFGQFWKKGHCVQFQSERGECVIGNFRNAFFHFSKIACVLVLVFLNFVFVDVVSAQSAAQKLKFEDFVPIVGSQDIAENAAALAGDTSLNSGQKAAAAQWLERIADLQRLPKGTPASIIAGAINIVLGLSGIVASLMFFIAGVFYITAQGEESQAEKAKKMILYTVIALVLISASFAIFTGISRLIFI